MLKDDNRAGTLRVLDFPGFYCSSLSEMLDSEEESALEALCEESSADREAAFKSWYDHTKFSEGFDHVARCCADYFREMIDDSIAFESMTSPREYNFTTDALFLSVPDNVFDHMLRSTPEDELDKVARGFFTSRPGFHSFYNPDWRTWGERREWDHNQRGALFTAFCRWQAEESNWPTLLDWLVDSNAFGEAVDMQTDWMAVYGELE